MLLIFSVLCGMSTFFVCLFVCLLACLFEMLVHNDKKFEKHDCVCPNCPGLII